MRIEIEARWLRVLLWLHGILYGLFFVFSIANLDYPMRHQTNFIILLVWTAVLLVHTGLHYTRIEASAQRRQAYRQGFADAVGRFADRTYDERLFALDDEGELVEVEAKRKRG